MNSIMEKYWTGVCDVYSYTQVFNTTTKITSSVKAKVLSAIPCRISFKSFGPTSQSQTVPSYIQKTVLYMKNINVITEGSELVVTQNGVITTYKMSGKPATYSNHQEIEVITEGST